MRDLLLAAILLVACSGGGEKQRTREPQAVGCKSQKPERARALVRAAAASAAAIAEKGPDTACAVMLGVAELDKLLGDVASARMMIARAEPLAARGVLGGDMCRHGIARAKALVGDDAGANAVAAQVTDSLYKVSSLCGIAEAYRGDNARVLAVMARVDALVASEKDASARAMHAISAARCFRDLGMRDRALASLRSAGDLTAIDETSSRLEYQIYIAHEMVEAGDVAGGVKQLDSARASLDTVVDTRDRLYRAEQLMKAYTAARSKVALDVANTAVALSGESMCGGSSEQYSGCAVSSIGQIGHPLSVLDIVDVWLAFGDCTSAKKALDWKPNPETYALVLSRLARQCEPDQREARFATAHELATKMEKTTRSRTLWRLAEARLALDDVTAARSLLDEIDDPYFRINAACDITRKRCSEDMFTVAADAASQPDDDRAMNELSAAQCMLGIFD